MQGSWQAVIAVAWATFYTGVAGAEAPNAPAPRARVLRVEHPEATEGFLARPGPVAVLVDRGLVAFTGRESPAAAWRSLVSTQETLGIKVVSRPGPLSGTRPAVVDAVVSSLLAAGHPPSRIVIWDRHLADLQRAGFADLARRHGVRVAGSYDAGYDAGFFYETALLGQLVHGDLEFGKEGGVLGRKSYGSKLLTQDIQKVVSVTPLLNHNLAGVSGHVVGLALDSIDNALRFQGGAGRLAETVPEILALEALHLRDRLVLCVTDALLCQYQGEERQLLHYSTMLNELWFGTDPVAMDVMAVGELDRQRRAADMDFVKTSLDLYDNCALMDLGISSPKRIDVVSLRLPPQPSKS